MVLKQCSLNYLEQTESTNRFLLDFAGELENSTAVYTLNQTSGRGRLGRVWQENNGESLALSAVYNMPAEKAAPLPLIAGLAVSNALDGLYGTKTQLKWSNDVILNNKKLAGILCESRLTGENARVVIGIGVNLLQPKEFFKTNDLEHAVSLRSSGIFNIDSEQSAATINNCLKTKIEQYLLSGFCDKIKDEYKAKCLTLGREIMVISGNDKRNAVAKDIADDGALVCSFAGNDEAVYGGEVSVRGIYGYLT